MFRGAYVKCWFFFFQAEAGLRDLVGSRGLGNVYKSQILGGYPLYLVTFGLILRTIEANTF